MNTDTHTGRKTRREELELRLAEGGAEALLHDAELRAWVESDDQAVALLESLALLDETFEAMASDEFADTDAPDALVAALLARPELTEPIQRPETASTARPGMGRRFARIRAVWNQPAWRAGWALAAVIILGLGLAVLVPNASKMPQDGLAADRENEALGERRSELSNKPKDLKELKTLGYVSGEAASSRNTPEPNSSLEEQLAVSPPSPATPSPAKPSPPSPAPKPSISEQERLQFIDQLREQHDSGSYEDGSYEGDDRDEAGKDDKSVADTLEDGSVADGSAADRFLRERRRVEGLTFLNAAGYWRNPWVPGDPDLRFLAARMDELAGRLPAGLHQLARRESLPFDPPEHDALAVYLHADHTVVDGPTRVALRVGVRAADAWAGRRTAMNLAVVLDLPPADEEIPAETAASLRALLEALGDAHDLGDRFHLFVAGRPGGRLVAPDDFRRGALLLAARRLFDPSPPSESSDADVDVDVDVDVDQSTDLEDILQQAGNAVRALDDPESPVGSSALLVVTTGDDISSLEDATSMAHALAVGGVRVSALGVGSEIGTGEMPTVLARLADAGQGSRRLVTRPADAAAAIEDELAQAARAVARAVRLRIRPAPGVKLVGVFDSEPLDAPAADRVRQAEQALDRRLAHKLGIEADRGDDEEGIQIVVPALYAGDAMTLLVDLVTSGPGPLVDVTVRYKDLVRVENGIARAHLDLAAGEPAEVATGPLEVSVARSLLAHEVKGCLEAAADNLDQGRGSQAAIASLTECTELLEGLAHHVPALADDPDLARDLALLRGYIQALEGSPDSETRAAVAQSLQYAGLLKTLPPPEMATAEPRR